MFITTDDGTRLHVIPATTGEVPLVLSNSLGTDVALWDAQFTAFSGHHSVWRYDTRGHGQSDAPAGDYSLDRLGKDLLAVVDATAAPQVDICGVSIGGLTALWAAIHAPTRVRKVILANTAARIGDVRMWADRIDKVHSEGMGPIAAASPLRWFTETFRSSHADLVERLRGTVERTKVDGYAGCCAALRDGDLRSVAVNVSCPTLVVTGAHDVATPPDAGKWLGEQIRGARVVELDAAHLSNIERAGDFNSAVKRFLSDG